MYTSGSTGTPKGVELTHDNILTVIRGFLVVVDEEMVGGTYTGYLPLAHIFEVTMELISLSLGMRIGYSSLLTLTDQSSAIAQGQQGDLSLLNPEMMPMVPLVLDRMKKSITQKVASRGKVFQRLFNHAVSYKTYWMHLGFGTPLLDAILFNKAKMILGGKLRRIVIGSAQVSEDSHVFARACLCRNILCGYGMTETAAAISIQLPGAMTPSVCGAPLRNIYVRLEPWPEGGYDPRDKPRPRGEILAGGSVVAKAYLNNPQLTEQSIVVIDGIRYLRTGDIGEMTEQGEIRIIDRKKDLFKGPTGEYIALGKVEADLKTCVLIENICVYGDPKSGRLVALVNPNRAELEELARRSGIRGSIDELCENHTVRREVILALKRHCLSKQLSFKETPSTAVLCPTPWTPETGFVTASMKVCRKPIIEHYRERTERELEALLRPNS
ncbi:long-chain-fatty-acid--CoA ligase 3 [Galendromus occidentalis]|uniref:long-chain-fatty-acid--CoA ligase n=1 Tax=Galendromus occidentalis TaxID=34638 RepID=A0AAJ7L6E5_9ACAR|nr:long-chain-fatty-acid--CoA ligase 3 [Galendromus occidentalis]